MRPTFPGRDRRAVLLPAPEGARRVARPRTVVVVGGGIAGLAAACGLAERGVDVELIEPHAELGGRVRAWQTSSAAGTVTMSRGFHAFFRQYYNLRTLLSRAGDLDDMLQPVADYPVVSAHGDRDSFTKIPRTPPWNFATFVARSPTFTVRDLARVDLDTALALLDVSFPQTYRDLENVSAAEFLDQLKFPHRARHLALEVFARSFFAHPHDFSAGELVAMFHSYFLGSAEGLLFDVARDDFDTALWRPLGNALEIRGVRRTTARVTEVVRSDTGWEVARDDGERTHADGVVLAAGPAATRDIVAASPDVGTPTWRKRVANVQLAPPFAVLRLWLNGPVREDRPAFLGTTAYGPLDNISVMERFERGAREWAATNRGSVVELHAYAIDEVKDGGRQLISTLRAELARVYPETAPLTVIAHELLIEQDCALLGTGSWEQRPEVRTPAAGIALAGDWVRTDLPIALMERAATTGWMAANELLRDWGVAGHPLWSVPTSSRHRWPGVSRALMARFRSRA